MELWDLYNKDRVLTGNQVFRGGDPIPNNQYFMAVEIWTINSKQQILLTKRHPNKVFALFWESTGGASLSGESSKQAAKRELAEETGIHATEDELIYLGTLWRENSFMDSYLCIKDVELHELQLQQEEVIDAKWATVEEFYEMNDQGFIVPIVVERFEHYKDKILEYMK